MRNDRTWEHNPTGVICNKKVLHVIFTNRYFQDEIFLGFKEGGEGEGSPKSALGAVSARPILHGLGMGAGRIPISCGRTRPGLSMGSCGPVTAPIAVCACVQLGGAVWVLWHISVCYFDI